MCAKNYENWLAADKVIAKIIRLTFFGPPSIIQPISTESDFYTASAVCTD